MGPYPFLDSDLPLAFAHRGGAAAGDENTVAAFARATAAGYRYIETDVHASADGVAVLFHDPDLTRLIGDPRRVEDLTWRELSRLRLRGEPLIPRLDETLDAWPHTRLNLDVKSDAAVTPTLHAVDALHARDRVLIGSFSDARLARVRAMAGPRQATSLGQREAARLWAASRWGRGLGGFVPAAPAIQVPVTHGPLRVVDGRLIAHARRLGMQVHVWTVDDPAQMHRLLDLGVDGIMTDQIEVLAAVYRERGHWSA